MFGTAVAWVVLVLLGLVLTQVVLKRQDLDPTQRRSAFLMGAGVCLFLVVTAAFAVWESTQVVAYANPSLDRDDLDPDSSAWAMVAGTVSDQSRVADRRLKYTIYARYTGPSRDLSDVRGERNLIVALNDGTQVRLSLVGVPQHSWNWPETRGTRHLKPGDPVCVYGYISPIRGGNLKGDFSMREVEFVFHGTSDALQSSLLGWAGWMGGLVHGVVAVLALVSAVGMGVLLVLACGRKG